MLMSGYQRCVSQAASILQRCKQHLVVGTPKLWSSFANMEQPYDYFSHYLQLIMTLLRSDVLMYLLGPTT